MRKRRVELHIEHSEISIFAGAGPSPGISNDSPIADTLGLMQARHAVCPNCGSPDLVLLTDAVAHSRLDLSTLNQGMQDGSVHYHRSPSGEWWICSKSLQQTCIGPS
jgi:hypothetical protein